MSVDFYLCKDKNICWWNDSRNRKHVQYSHYWSGFSLRHTVECVWICVCVWCTFCVCTVSPPAQQVEEDEDDVQVEGEGSGDVLLRIQTETEQPHHQLTVQHQKLVQKKKRQRESTGHGFKIQLHVSFNSDSYRTEIRSCNDGHKSSILVQLCKFPVPVNRAGLPDSRRPHQWCRSSRRCRWIQTWSGPWPESAGRQKIWWNQNGSEVKTEKSICVEKWKTAVSGFHI